MDLNLHYNLVKYLSDLIFPESSTDEEQKKIRSQSRYFIVREVEIILHNLHADSLAGHFEIEATYHRVAERYYWNQVYSDIREYVRTCDECQRRGGPTKHEYIHPIKVEQPFERLGMDIVGPLPETRKGNKYMVVATEYLTKWPEARAIPDAKAASVVQFFYEDIISRHGSPKILLTDQVTHFVNQMLDELLERFNRMLCEALAKYAATYKEDWDIYLPSVLFAYRTMIHSTTRHEPFYLTYGGEATFPVELQIPTYPTEIGSEEELLLKRVYELIGNLPEKRVNERENISRSQEKQKERYDKKVVEQKFYIGDKVLLYRNPAKKLEEKWEGPFYIHDIGLNGTYQLRNVEGKVRK
ncbi:2246_t:CDS:2 [Entrophospora sp. SA101]|nr:15405_t:CDS:2 [Entrophospora sp. SA101]CAJ0869402.1 2246_t:CDS:2 [Entrophospora sp. SA101]